MICRWGQGSSWDAPAKMRFRCPAALDAGDLGVWSSRRAVPLRPSRCSRAAGLGGARRSRGGGVSFAGGDPPDSDHPRVEFAFCSPGSSIWRLANNLVLTPSPHSSLRHTRPVCSSSDSTRPLDGLDFASEEVTVAETLCQWGALCIASTCVLAPHAQVGMYPPFVLPLCILRVGGGWHTGP